MRGSSPQKTEGFAKQNRLQIITHLSDDASGHPTAAGRSVSEIEALFPELNQSTLSQHLGKLRKAQIVKTLHQSETIFYSITDHDVVRLLRTAIFMLMIRHWR